MHIYIWGTGRIAGKLVGKIIDLQKITAFIDKDESKKEYMDKRVITPAQLKKESYDAIVVANLSSKEIYQTCVELGIDLKKVIFPYENIEMQDLNQDYELTERVLGEDYANIIRNRYHMVRGVEEYDVPEIKKQVSGGYNDTDYVRIQCFELVVKELRKKKISASVAEVGVFRGEFAQYINLAFPDSKLYLFDTFDGFNATEALNEMRNGNCTESFVKAYENTNVSMVLNRMKYLDNVVIKQGFFPDSLDGLEDRFQFVSIDVDFEESIYNCLEYFYPRMVSGGYIFVHDYNSDLRGVEKAVDDFENNKQIMLHKMPLCDANGTLVIMV